MKKILFINIFEIFCICLFMSCNSESSEDTPTINPTENISGIIIDENNIPLQDILVIFYADETLRLDYTGGTQGDIYSDENGRFSLTMASNYQKGMDQRIIYVQAIDTSRTYQETTSIVTIEYDSKSYIGQGNTTIVMNKTKK